MCTCCLTSIQSKKGLASFSEVIKSAMFVIAWKHRFRHRRLRRGKYLHPQIDLHEMHFFQKVAIVENVKVLQLLIQTYVVVPIASLLIEIRRSG